MSKASDLLGGGSTPGKAERENYARFAAGNLLDTRNNVLPFYNYGAGLVNRFGGQGGDALQELANFLSRGVSDQQRAAYSNQLLGRTDDAFARGSSDLLAAIRAQGGTSPLDSSVTAGALANLYGQRAQAQGQAGSQADEWARQAQIQNLLQRYQALFGAAGEGTNIGFQGAGMLSNAGNLYASQLSDIANQATQAEQAKRQQALATIGGIASLGGSLFGGGGGMRPPAGMPSPLPGRNTPAPDDLSPYMTPGMVPYAPSGGSFGTAVDPILSTPSLAPYGSDYGNNAAYRGYNNALNYMNRPGSIYGKVDVPQGDIPYAAYSGPGSFTMGATPAGYSFIRLPKGF